MIVGWRATKHRIGAVVAAATHITALGTIFHPIAATPATTMATTPVDAGGCLALDAVVVGAAAAAVAQAVVVAAWDRPCTTTA